MDLVNYASYQNESVQTEFGTTDSNGYCNIQLFTKYIDHLGGPVRTYLVQQRMKGPNEETI